MKPEHCMTFLFAEFQGCCGGEVVKKQNWAYMQIREPQETQFDAQL